MGKKHTKLWTFQVRKGIVKSVSWVGFILFDVFGVRVILYVRVYEFGCDPFSVTEATQWQIFRQESQRW
jgi:hypothetical protein